jgi:hypothetical protein
MIKLKDILEGSVTGNIKGEKRFVPHLDHEHIDWGYFSKGNLPEPIDDWVKETIEND